MHWCRTVTRVVPSGVFPQRVKPYTLKNGDLFRGSPWESANRLLQRECPFRMLHLYAIDCIHARADESLTRLSSQHTIRQVPTIAIHQARIKKDSPCTCGTPFRTNGVPQESLNNGLMCAPNPGRAVAYRPLSSGIAQCSAHGARLRVAKPRPCSPDSWPLCHRALGKRPRRLLWSRAPGPRG